MSTPNSERISVNEKGEVLINDPELAAAVQELSDDELDAIAGGLRGDNAGGNCGGQCGQN
jgi:hypothetical protein